VEKRDDQKLTEVIEAWCRSIVNKDAAAAERLRGEQYTSQLPGGGHLTKAQELAALRSIGFVDAGRVLAVRRGAAADTATAVFEYSLPQPAGGPKSYISTVEFELRGEEWLAMRSVVKAKRSGWSKRQSGLSLVQRIRRRLRRLAPLFQDLAYLPHRIGEDFGLARRTAVLRTLHDETGLPMPPPELWLGYNYPEHGKTHVTAMLEILHASHFDFRPGDRVLDFGCGAGRMLRHLHELANTCELWGVDISAEHIFWCKRHLSPPFRFATTTKVPHLPFEDRSFRFIYCGSVFTHIDDLADAWLLELRRILTPDGRLYVTIHDNRTIELIDGGRAQWLNWVRTRPVYRQFKDSLDMMAIGRDNESQVFYDRDYFSRMVSQSFDVLSVSPEAYFYQTAFLLGRRE
jgi:ubiquinone/menaquinone biosynthesis C-methylase UbiE